MFYLNPVFVTVIIFLASIDKSSSRPDRIKLKDIQVLTLKKGLWTAARRTRPIPQLACVGGTAGCSYQPETVQCLNKGWDGVSVNWKCKAEMDKKLAFGQLEISCEGYDYPADPYVYAGSCGLEYTINYADSSGKDHSANKSNIGGLFLAASGFLLLLVLFLFLISRCHPARKANPTPPPAGFVPQYREPPPSYPSSSYPRSNESSNSPGFGTGVVTGSVLGYLAGNISMSSSKTTPPRDSYYTPPRNSFSPYGPSVERGSSPTRIATGFATTKNR